MERNGTHNRWHEVTMFDDQSEKRCSQGRSHGGDGPSLEGASFCFYFFFILLNCNL